MSDEPFQRTPTEHPAWLRPSHHRIDPRIAMTANDVRETVYESLAPLLVPKGFKLHDREEYRRVLRGVRQTVSLRLVDYAPTFKFTLDFFFRVEAAETILQQFIEVLPQFRQVRETCCVTLDQLVPSAGEEIVVKNNRSLQKALSELKPALERDVLPFLDSHQDLNSIDHLMNSSCTREWFAHAYGPDSSMNSVIVARLAGNPDWEQLVSTHRQRLRGNVSDESLATYERLVQHLSQMP